jgi:hypothetical protein
MLSRLELNLRSIAPVAPLLVQGAGCHKNEVTNLVPNGIFYHISLQRGHGLTLEQCWPVGSKPAKLIL